MNSNTRLDHNYDFYLLLRWFMMKWLQVQVHVASEQVIINLRWTCEGECWLRLWTWYICEWPYSITVIIAMIAIVMRGFFFFFFFSLQGQTRDRWPLVRLPIDNRKSMASNRVLLIPPPAWENQMFNPLSLNLVLTVG